MGGRGSRRRWSRCLWELGIDAKRSVGEAGPVEEALAVHEDFAEGEITFVVSTGPAEEVVASLAAVGSSYFVESCGFDVACLAKRMARLYMVAVFAPVRCSLNCWSSDADSRSEVDCLLDRPSNLDMGY